LAAEQARVEVEQALIEADCLRGRLAEALRNRAAPSRFKSAANGTGAG